MWSIVEVAVWDEARSKFMGARVFREAAVGRLYSREGGADDIL